MTGKTLNQRYQLEQLLAKGEHGSLFLATEIASGEMLAVRTLPSGTDLRSQAGLRFLRQVRRLEGEAHPNLLVPLETSQSEGTAYQVVPYYPSLTLEEALREAPFSIAEGVSLLRQAAAGLAHLHALGIAHLGIAPHNLLISREEGGLQVALSDACLSSLAGGDFPWGGLDSAPFRAPEENPELAAQPDERADLYALGMIGYLVLAGRAPFTGVSVRQVLQRHLAEPPPAPRDFNPDLPHSLAEILLRLVAKTPHQRYQSAQGLLADLARWENLPAGSTGRQEPPRSRFASPPLTGRTVERDVLLAALSRSASGRGSLLLLSGPDGMGKRSLFRSLLPHAAASEALVLGTDLPARRWCAPFQLPLDLLADLSRRLHLLPPTRLRYVRKRLAEALGGNTAILAEMQPLLADLLPADAQPPPLPRWKARRRALHVLGEAFAALADARHPLVLWLGNLEAGDADSLAWLSELASRLPHTPIVLVAAISPEHAGAKNAARQWLERIGPDSGLQRIELAPLNGEETARLARIRLGLAPDGPTEGVTSRLSAWIHGRWGGNPLAHELVLATLVSRGHVRPGPAIEGHHPGGWRCAWEEVEGLRLPDTLGGLTAAKCAPLPEQQRLVLQAAAMFPDTFDLPALSALVEHLPAEVVLEHVESAAAQQILRWEGERIRFSHRVYKDHFYQAISGGRKEHLHRLAGAIMESEPHGAPLIHHSVVARHFHLGGDTARARRHGLTAADAALRQQASAGAAAIYERIIRRPEPDANLSAMLVSLGAAHAMLGAHPQALEALHQACALGIPEPLHLQVLPLMAWCETERGEHEAAVGHVEEALGLLESSLPESQVGAALGRIAAAARHRYQALRTSASVERAAPLEGRELKIALLLEQAALALGPHQPARAVLADEKLLQLCAAFRPAPVTVRAMIRLGESLGDPEGPYLAQAAGLLEQHAFPHERALLAAAQGRCLSNLLQFRHAQDAHFLAAETFAAIGDIAGAQEASSRLFDLARTQGPCGAVLDHARRMGALALRLDAESDLRRARSMQIYGTALAGKTALAAASQSLKALAESALAQGDLATGRESCFLAADLLMGAGRQEEALACFAAMPPRIGDTGGVWDYVIDAARAEGHMLEAVANAEHREWHQQQAWGLLDGVRAAEKRFPRLAMELLALDVMRMLLKGETERALELVRSGEQVLESQGARIMLGRLYHRLAEGLKAHGHKEWPAWAAKALAQLETAGAQPHAAAARRLLEQNEAVTAHPDRERSEEDDAPDEAAESVQYALPARMLGHLGDVLAGDAGAAPAMQSSLLRAAMEAVNAEFALFFLPDEAGRLNPAVQWPRQQENPEVNRWLVDNVWRLGKGELMEVFHPSGESEAGNAVAAQPQSALCVPLTGGGTTYGVIYLGSAVRRLRFDEADLQRLSLLAEQAGIAVALGAALETGSASHHSLQEDNRKLREAAEWCPPAAAEPDAGAILSAYLEQAAARQGFTGALLFWREEGSGALVLGAATLNGDTPPVPDEFATLNTNEWGEPGAQALRERRPVRMGALTGAGAGGGTPTLCDALNIRGGVWLPLPLQTEPAGVLLLTSQSEPPRDLTELRGELELPLRLIAPALVKIRLAERLMDERDVLRERLELSEAANQRLSRFVPGHMRGSATEQGPAGGVEKRLPVAFGQMYDLARLSRLGASETLAELQACYSKITEALGLHQGSLDRIMGDRWIAHYGGGVESALWGVLTLQEMLADFQRQRAGLGLPALSTGIGLHLGDTIGGVLETDQCIEPVVVGEGVQIAARLAEMCRSFRAAVLVSDETVQALEDVSPFDLRSLGLFRTAPGERRVGVYELFSTRKPEIRDAMRKRQGEWNAAMRHYRLGEWEKGAELFKSYLAHFPQDRPGRHFLRYCRQRVGQ